MAETTRELTGLPAIAAMFERSQAQGRAAFMPFFPIGYPNLADSLEIIKGMAEAGADGFEIGIPFSDPLADGPTNQAAAQVALENGVNVNSVLEAVRKLRSEGVRQPMLMFTYLNPLIAYGTEKFIIDAKAAGADGLICPDLPPEEAHLFADVCARENMALVFFLAPTSNPARIRVVAEQATGFIYVVSLTGTTGARSELPSDLAEFIGRVRAETDRPLVLGFGISTPEHVHTVAGLVNGFIVGSALVRAAGESAEQAVSLARLLRKSQDT